MLGLTISLWFGHSPGWAYDFYAYYEAALRLIATGSPYQAETLSGPFQPGPFGLYLYSPPLALLFVPLTTLGEEAATVLWLVAAHRHPVADLRRDARVARHPTGDVRCGHVERAGPVRPRPGQRQPDRDLPGRPRLALAGQAARVDRAGRCRSLIRPTMGLICAWWLLRGMWRPVAWTAVAFAVLVALTLPFVGLDRWFEYVTVLRNVSDVTGVRSNVDLGSAVLLFGGPECAGDGGALRRLLAWRSERCCSACVATAS